MAPEAKRCDFWFSYSRSHDSQRSSDPEVPGREAREAIAFGAVCVCVHVWWEMQGLWSSYYGIYIYGIYSIYIWIYTHLWSLYSTFTSSLLTTLILLRGTSSLPLSHVVWVCTEGIGTEAVFLALFQT